MGKRNTMLDWPTTLHCCACATRLVGMKNTRWWQYVNRLLGDDSYSAAADKAGFDKSAFTRWKKGAAADPAFVVKLARAYNKNVLEALVEAEFLTEDEAHLTEVAPDFDIETISTPDLAAELDRRVKVLKFLNDMGGDNTDAIPHANVISMIGRSNVHDGTVRDFDYPAGTYAADSSPDEDALREEEGSDPVD